MAVQEENGFSPCSFTSTKPSPLTELYPVSSYFFSWEAIAENKSSYDLTVLPLREYQETCCLA